MKIPEVHQEIPWWWGLIIALFGFLLYLNSVPHDYVLDDAGAITNNLFVQQGLKGIPSLLTVDLWHFDNVNLGYYRPLSLVTLAIEYQFFGKNPHINHLVNVIFYAITLWVLFLLLLKLFKGKHPIFAFFIALLFAAHPVHTEVVANIKSRDEILSFMNLIIALFFLLKYAEKQKVLFIITSLIFFYLSLLSKETSTLGVALAPLILFFAGEKNWKKILTYSGFFIAAALLFFIQKKMLMGSLSGTVPDDIVNYPYHGMDTRIATSFLIFLHLLRLLVYPFILKYDYSYNAIPAGQFSDLTVLFGLLLFVSISVYAFWKFLKKDIYSFCIFFFMITVAPALAFILLRGGIMAERFLFAPSLGFCVALVSMSTSVFKSELIPSSEKITEWIKKNSNLSFALLLILMAYSMKTIQRNVAWTDNFTLFSTDVKNNPNSAQNHRHLGSEYINLAIAEKDAQKKLNDFNLGLAELRAAIQINPRFGDAYFKMGVAHHAAILNVDSAIYYYQKAIDAAPGFAISYNNLGIIYQSLKKNDMASYYYNKAIEMNPNFPDAKKNSAALKAATGLDVHLMPMSVNLDSMKANTENKDQMYYYNMGTFYASKGDYKSAMMHLLTCLKMNPTNIDAYINLGNCYGILGMYKESIQADLEVLKLNPNNLSALQNLAISYDRMGDKNKGDEMRDRLRKLMEH